MKATDEAAIAQFFDAGGRVSYVKETVEISEPELVRVLAECGLVVTYRANGRSFAHDGKRFTPSALIALANKHRRSMGLPALALRTT